MMYIVSACLSGVNCRYDGKNSANEKIVDLVNKGRAIIVCPEILGGLPIPRIPCEILQDSAGNRQVINKDGKVLTKEFQIGAEKTLEIAKINGINKAILKSTSPSCGCGIIHDGTFSGGLKKGNGLTSELLIKNGIKVYTENNWMINNK